MLINFKIVCLSDIIINFYLTIFNFNNNNNKENSFFFFVEHIFLEQYKNNEFIQIVINDL